MTEIILNFSELFISGNISKKVKVIKVIIVLGALISLASCKRSEKPLSWNSEYTLPIVHGTLNITDLIADSLVEVGSDSSIILKYEGNLLDVDLTEVLALPDTIIRDTFQAPFPTPINFSPGQVFINTPEEQELDLKGAYLSFVKIKSGIVEYYIESTVKGAVTYTYELPSATDWLGNVFSKSISVPAAPSGGTSSKSGVFSLDGYYLDMTGQSGVEFNKILTTINCKVAASNSQDVSISSADVITVANDFKELTIEEAEGYFGEHQITTGLEYSTFEGFENWVSGSIDIEEVDVDLIVKNGLGVDLFIQLNELVAKGASSTVSMNHSLIGDLISLARPTKYYDTIIPTTYSTHLSPSNSNIDDFLEVLPQEVGYDIELEINPLGNISGYNDFYNIGSPTGIFLNASMPLSIIAQDLTLEDTLDVAIDDALGLNSITLQVEVENGFPLSADLELAILDVNDKVVSRVFTPEKIESASVNTSGKVTSTSNSIHEIKLGAKDIEWISTNGKVVLSVTFNTPGIDHVVIYDHYKLDYKVKGDVNITISSSNEE